MDTLQIVFILGMMLVAGATGQGRQQRILSQGLGYSSYQSNYLTRYVSGNGL